MKRGLSAREIALAGVSSALVTLATLALRIHIPATSGYFNLGEAAIYTIALFFGPRVAAIAGGVGSAVADIVGGYALYAPATLAIKAAEGWVVGALRGKGSRRHKVLTLVPALACLVSALLVEQSLVRVAVWFVIGAVAGIAAAILAPGDLLAMLAGGAVMVTGYFVYEAAIVGAGALSEVPWNIGQVTVGVLAASAIRSAVEKRLPSFTGGAWA